MCASDALFVSAHTLQKVRDAAADGELSHRLQTATAPRSKAKIYRRGRGETRSQLLGQWSTLKCSAAPGINKQTHASARAHDFDRLLPCLQEFLLSQAEGLRVCRPSWSNRLRAMFGFTGRRKARDRPRDGCRKLPKSSQLVLTRPASVERRGKPQILRLPVDPELLL